MNKRRLTGKRIRMPPERIIPLPTPPPSDQKSASVVQKPASVVSDLLDIIQSLKDGRYSGEPWHAFKVTASEYEEFEELVKEDGFVQDKLRYDYFPSANRFVLRMPSVLHEVFAARVVEEIVRQLNEIASHQDMSAEFARDIKHCGSARIEFDDPDYANARHDPDAQFQHSKETYPGVVIEISYSQKRKDLEDLAEHYILGSDGQTRVVVGLDIDYKSKMFCDNDGIPKANPAANLRLQLKDFAFRGLRTPNLVGEVSIPATDLGTLLNVAKESDSKLRKENRERLPSEDRGFSRKRKRDVTPPERLSRRRNKIYNDEEKRVSERAEMEDLDYEP